MLEQLFGSKTRSKLLFLFLKNPNKNFFVRELTREVGAQLNSIRRELRNLETFGLIRAVDAQDEVTAEVAEVATKEIKKPKKIPAKKGQKKYYVLNDNFIICPELKALFLKAEMLAEQALVQKLLEAGNIKYLALTGIFVGLQDAATDIFIVGTINKKKIEALVKKFEKEMKSNINYTVMTKTEFDYRRGITDRFLYGILESKKIVACDQIFNNETTLIWTT